MPDQFFSFLLSLYFSFFMPFSYFIYYHIASPPTPPPHSFIPSSFLTFFFFSPHIHYCLLKLSSLLDISLRCLKIRNGIWPLAPHSHSLTRGIFSSSFLAFCSPLVSSFHFPGSSVWSHFSPFPWLQLAMPAVSIPFFFPFTLLPSSTPICLHFHIATGHKGTAGPIFRPV